MSILGTKPFQLNTALFANHKALATYCRERGIGDVDPHLKMLAKCYLKMLCSPNGNDVLEEVCVRATGREPKADETKHGADSQDGELEAKPMKTAYNAHISDDTPASLLRHQTIPYILLSEWTKDGEDCLWALLTSYRIFDVARYRGILATFPPEYRDQPELPTAIPDRLNTLRQLVSLREQLVKERNIPRYVRSNPLPVECLASLQVGQYVVWSAESVGKSRGKAHKIIWDLWTRQNAGEFKIDETFVHETEAIREAAVAATAAAQAQAPVYSSI